MRMRSVTLLYMDAAAADLVVLLLLPMSPSKVPAPSTHVSFMAMVIDSLGHGH